MAENRNAEGLLEGPGLGAVGVVVEEAGGVAEDEEVAGAEGRLAEGEGVGERGPEVEGEGGGEGVVLVEHHAPEAERPEPAPVDGTEVGDGEVGEGQPRVTAAGDDGGASRDALQIQPLAQRLLSSAHLGCRREAHPAFRSSYQSPGVWAWTTEFVRPFDYVRSMFDRILSIEFDQIKTNQTWTFICFTD